MLQRWEVHVTSDADFAAGVWRRIAAGRQRECRGLLSRASFFIGQPAWAAAAVVTMLIAGLSAGSWWQDHTEERARAAGAVAYVRAVNPVVHETTHGP